MSRRSITHPPCPVCQRRHGPNPKGDALRLHRVWLMLVPLETLTPNKRDDR